MPADYYIVLRDHAGAQVAVFDKFHHLRYRRQRNKPGWIQLNIDLPDDRTDLFALDYQVEVLRRGDWPGTTWQVDFAGFHRRYEYPMLPSGQEEFVSWSVGYLELLARRVGLYWHYKRDVYSQEGYLVIDGTPPEVIGEFVDREVGPAAVYSGVDRRAPGLTLAAIAPVGAQITEKLRNTQLLTRCQELAKAHDLEMRIVGNGPAQFEFRVADLLGTDRRVGNLLGNPPTIFDVGFGNMAQPHFISDRLQEVNHIFVAGAGTGWERPIYDQTSPLLVADSPWNLREEFLDAQNLSVEEQLATRAAAELEKNKPVVNLAFDPIETPACKYGRDWDLGDLVTARYRGVQRNYRVEALTISLDEAGVETLDAELTEHD